MSGFAIRCPKAAWLMSAKRRRSVVFGLSLATVRKPPPTMASAFFHHHPARRAVRLLLRATAKSPRACGRGPPPGRLAKGRARSSSHTPWRDRPRGGPFQALADALGLAHPANRGGDAPVAGRELQRRRSGRDPVFGADHLDPADRVEPAAECFLTLGRAHADIGPAHLLTCKGGTPVIENTLWRSISLPLARLQTSAPHIADAMIAVGITKSSAERV